MSYTFYIIMIIIGFLIVDEAFKEEYKYFKRGEK